MVFANQVVAETTKGVFEESPDTTGQGGRETDPGKPAGKCHRNTPPMARPQLSRAQARVKWCGKSAPASW